MDPTKWRDFGGNASWGTFGGPNRFRDEKINHQRSQSAPENEKEPKNESQEPLECEKEFQKKKTRMKNNSKSRPFSHQGPADCAKRLQ